MKPKVTIALITFNRIEYLEQAIKAILTQTFKNFELIIMDNGSSVETFELVQPYLNNQVKYHRNPVNSRAFVNEAFDIANGEYLMITHDDDIMLENLIETEVNVLDSDSDIVMVATNTAYIDKESNVIKKNSQDLSKTIIWSKNEFIKDYINKNIWIPCPTVLMRKSIFDRENLRFNLSAGPAADLYLWFETNVLDYKICLLNESLYNYRIHAEQDNQKSQIEMEFVIFDFLMVFLFKEGLSEMVPKMKKYRYKIIFYYITNLYFKNMLNTFEFKFHYSNLKNIGFKYYHFSFNGLVKMVLAYLNNLTKSIF